MDEVDRQVLAQLPWEVHAKHVTTFHFARLEYLVREQAGRELRLVERNRLAAWRQDLRDFNAVVEYDWTHPNGFYMTARLAGDGDVTRPPMVGEVA